MKRRLGQQPISADVGLLRVLLGKCGLAQPSGWLPFVAYNVPSAITANTNVFRCTIGRSLTVRYWNQSVVVLTTNDVSNYWTIKLRKNASTVLDSFTTAGDTAGTWALHKSGALDSALSGGTDLTLGVRAEKTGSPGALYLAGPEVFVV